jgi:ubiquinol-cytochrome c reductase cytochrome c1 subunit
MIKITTILAAGLMALGLAVPAMAQEHETIHIERQPWSFGGIFGKYDEHQLQRGFQVFREVCAFCHSARLMAFRNLSEEGGPGFSEEQVKALAAEYTVNDPEAEGGTRKALPSDRWPGTGQSDADLAAAFGMVPPDLSVMAKARSISSPFPQWVFNYFTTYSEGGPDYIHALLMGYHDEVPEGATNSDGTPFTLPDGKYYNDVFPGHAIGMAPPLADEQVAYANADGSEVPAEMLTAEQYSRDVSAFLMWMAEPHLVARKEAGFQVIAFLLVFAGLMYLVKRKIWSRVEH